MRRRGKCRCGTILAFEPTGHGYKVRCPGCHAVVRLRRRGGATPAATPPPWPGRFDGGTPGAGPGGVDLDGPSVPLALTERPAFRAATRRARGRRWALAAALAGLVLAAGAALWVGN